MEMLNNSVKLIVLDKTNIVLEHGRYIWKKKNKDHYLRYYFLFYKTEGYAIMGFCRKFASGTL